MKQTEEIFEAIERLQHLAALFGKRRGQLAKRAGLTEAQWRVLEGVSDEHFIPSMFADGLDNTRGAVSKILKQLIEKKLITAAISREDGRQRRYRLTARGDRTIESLRKLRRHAIRRIWSGLPLDDLVVFNRLCDSLITNLRSYAVQEDEQEK